MQTTNKIFLTIVVGSLRRGGAEIQLNEILPGLDKEKYHIEVVLISTRGELADSLEENNVKIINPWFDTKAKSLNILSRLFRFCIIIPQLFIYFIKNRLDIVHFYLPQSYCLAMPIAIITGIRNTVMSRLSLNNYQDSRKWMWQFEKVLHFFTAVPLTFI